MIPMKDCFVSQYSRLTAIQSDAQSFHIVVSSIRWRKTVKSIELIEVTAILMHINDSNQ